jgi:predicted phage terminase large subunit-like protein
MLFLPPRSGKSLLATIHYPVWRLEQDPSLRVIVGAYNQSYASSFGRKSRRIAQSRFPLSVDSTAVDRWETPAGGGYRSVGVGSGVTGQGGNLIVIDDPVKSREEAESETYRERVWEWYTDDLWTRQEPDAAITLIMTRWHADDLGGRLLQRMESGEGEQWKVCSLPALAEENDPMGREPGDALCPERFTAADYLRAKSVLGTYSFECLYQQRPGEREGNLFKRSWFPITEASPAEAIRVRYWDKAASEAGGDFTVGLRMARSPSGVYSVEDVVRGQWSPGERDAVIRQTAAMDASHDPATSVWLEQEPGSGGKESAMSSIRLLAGYTVRVETVTGDKSVRAGPFAAQAEAGNVRLLKGSWNHAFLEELCSFPTGKHDDIVDACSGSFNKLAAGLVLEFS